MNIVISALATGFLLVNSAGWANAFAVPTLVTEAATVTPTVFYDSDVTENADATTWNEYLLQAPLGNDYVIENLSTCQTLIDGVVAPVGNGGLGRIRVTDGAISKILKCNTTKIGGQVAREFDQYSTGSISRYLYDQVEPLLDATPDLDYFSTYNHGTGTYTRNAACWAASIDLSCIVVASNDGSGWFRQRGGTLITARHVLLARHYPYGIGTQLRFVNALGVVETRTVIGTSAASIAVDLWICTLDAAVTIATPCVIAGNWIAQDKAVPFETAEWYSGGLAIHTDQNARVYVASLGQTIYKTTGYTVALTINGTTFNQCELQGYMDHLATSAVPSEFATSKKFPVAGDSGQPSFVIKAGNPVLLWTWTTPVGGTPVYLHNGAVVNALIAVADANAGISTGLTVTVAPDPTL